MSTFQAITCYAAGSAGLKDWLPAARTQPISLHTQPPTPLCFAPQFRIPFRFAGVLSASPNPQSPARALSRKNENPSILFTGV